MVLWHPHVMGTKPEKREVSLSRLIHCNLNQNGSKTLNF